MKQLPLLVVDGYNVMLAEDRYGPLLEQHTSSNLVQISQQIDDPFAPARERLISDVAAFGQREYEACVVFDGANNLSSERQSMSVAGVRVIFSRQGESADDVIERIVTQARTSGRSVSLVTSDNTIRSSVGSVVTRLSSSLLLREMRTQDQTVATFQKEHVSSRMTVEDRIDPAVRQKLWQMLKNA